LPPVGDDAVFCATPPLPPVPPVALLVVNVTAASVTLAPPPTNKPPPAPRPPPPPPPDPYDRPLLRKPFWPAPPAPPTATVLVIARLEMLTVGALAPLTWMPWNAAAPLMVWLLPVIFTVTLALLACSCASELDSVKPLVILMLTLEPVPAAATAATAVFQSV
jgi:hypothetical protein